MLASKKRLINQVLRSVGHIITREPCVPAWQIFFAVLRVNSVMPQTVFDIGVAQGTPWLYGAFPDAFYYLMDPARESLTNMQRWPQSLHAEILDVALGASEDTEVIDVRDEISGSTLFREVGPYTSVARCDVPVRLFDAIIDDFKRPALCKIDVRGAELIALHGISTRNRYIGFVIIETSATAAISRCPEIFDLMKRLNECGFMLYDVIGLTKCPPDQALAQIDLASSRRTVRSGAIVDGGLDRIPQ